MGIMKKASHSTKGRLSGAPGDWGWHRPAAGPVRRILSRDGRLSRKDCRVIEADLREAASDAEGSAFNRNMIEL